MASNGITARRSFHRIWIAGKKPLVKRAPVYKFSSAAASEVVNMTPSGVDTVENFRLVLSVKCMCIYHQSVPHHRNDQNVNPLAPGQ